MGRGGGLTLIDVCVLVRELRKLVLNKRIQNVYSLNKRTYMFKMTKPNTPKVNVIVESGVRMHATRFVREKDPFPLPFAMKLRKHLKSRRVTELQQIGMDRVIDMTVGVGDKCHHVIFEFYAAGNVILTDNQYRILDLLRTHIYRDQEAEEESTGGGVDDGKVSSGKGGGGDGKKGKKKDKKQQKGEGKEKKGRKRGGSGSSNSRARAGKNRSSDDDDVEARVRVGEIYPVAVATQNALRLVRGLATASDREASMAVVDGNDCQPKLTELTPETLSRAMLATLELKASAGADDKSKTSLTTSMQLKTFLGSNLSCTGAFGAALLDHCVFAAKLDGRLRVDKALASDLVRLAPLVAQLRTLPSLIGFISGVVRSEDGTPKNESSEGYILIADDKKYREYTPVLLAQHESRKHLRFESFNEAVDEFFSCVEAQRSDTKRASQAKVRELRLRS